MKLYACSFLVVVSMFGMIFCSNDPYAELPSVLSEICKKSRVGDDSGDNSDCKYLAVLMKPCDLKMAQEARKVAMRMSCYETMQGWVSEEEQEALKFLSVAERWADAAREPVKKLGQRHGLSEKTINEATAYCQDKIQGKMQSKVAQMSECLQSGPPECLGCNLEKKLSWWPWGKKKS
jgi:hypothetical protein